MEVASTEVTQDTNMSHESDDSASAVAAATGDGSVAKAKAETLGIELPSKDLLFVNISQCSIDIYLLHVSASWFCNFFSNIACTIQIISFLGYPNCVENYSSESCGCMGRSHEPLPSKVYSTVPSK